MAHLPAVFALMAGLQSVGMSVQSKKFSLDDILFELIFDERGRLIDIPIMPVPKGIISAPNASHNL